MGERGKEKGLGNRGMKAYACSKGEFQVVGAKCVVVDCDFNDVVKELWFAEEVFCNPKPKAEKLQRFC